MQLFIPEMESIVCFCVRFFFARQAKQGWLAWRTDVDGADVDADDVFHQRSSSCAIASYAQLWVVWERCEGDREGCGARAEAGIRETKTGLAAIVSLTWAAAVVATGAHGGAGSGDGGGGSCAYFCVTFQSISILCSQWRMTFVNVRHFRFPFQPQMEAWAGPMRECASKGTESPGPGPGPGSGLKVTCPKSQSSPTPRCRPTPCSLSLPPLCCKLHPVPQDTEGGQRMSLMNLMSNIFVVSLIFLWKAFSRN